MLFLYKMLPMSSMFRLVNLRFSRAPNTLFRRGDLVAMQDIKQGECIRVPAPKKIHRTKEERREVDRLADMSYKHATQ